MRSEELDKKIKEAADHHHPAYDETAWADMEKLLDVHLPQKKDDRKRFLFFLLFFLLLGSAATLFFVSNNKRKQTAVTDQQATKRPDNTTSISDQQKTEKVNTDNTITDPVAANKENSNSSTSTNTSSTNSSITSNTTSVGSATTNVQFVTGQATVGKKQKSNRSAVPVDNSKSESSSSNNLKQTASSPGLKKAGDQNNDISGLTKSSENTSSNTIKPTTENNRTTGDQGPVKKDVVATNSNVAQPPVPKEEKANTPVAVVKENSPKAKSKKSNSFAFTISAGPDISAAGSDKLGKVKLLAGLGVQYTIKDRFTIRTGFYSSRKVYSADPSEYHAPASFYTFYPYLQKVDADCKVYEIPLSVVYNFKGSAKHNFFASAGLSSYLMKKETYNYYYKTSPTGSTYSTKWTILDENKHYFSVMTLSGGYQRDLNRSISLTVEPYLKLPLSGVGYGKVKLNSGGVLFTLGIKPFQQKNKEKK